ncbi:ACT domain-containing protein [Aerococcaceae bacterium DSM 111022]|nr:ACT domain-containing protein [Aerococcaceae bacterium DSM 111022]MBG9988047.1 ACT domain-containing protein [Aerococcaceae bacterium DSM 111176]
MKAVITVVGKDEKGIIAKVANACFENNVNIVDVAQKVLDGYFTMTMVVDITEVSDDFENFKNKVVGLFPNMKINVMHENIFESMHRI